MSYRADFILIEGGRAKRVIQTNARVANGRVCAGNGTYYSLADGHRISTFNPPTGLPMRLVCIRNERGKKVADYSDLGDTPQLIAQLTSGKRRSK